MRRHSDIPSIKAISISLDNFHQGDEASIEQASVRGGYRDIIFQSKNAGGAVDFDITGAGIRE